MSPCPVSTTGASENIPRMKTVAKPCSIVMTISSNTLMKKCK